MCCYRDIKNFERFNLIVQSMICLAVLQLKNIQTLVAALKPPNPTSNNNNNDNNSTTDTNDTIEKKDEDPKNDSNWSLKEVEQLLILISKAFLLNFPLYIAYKHGVHSRLDDISAQEAQVTGNLFFFRFSLKHSVHIFTVDPFISLRLSACSVICMTAKFPHFCYEM